MTLTTTTTKGAAALLEFGSGDNAYRRPERFSVRGREYTMTPGGNGSGCWTWFAGDVHGTEDGARVPAWNAAGKPTLITIYDSEPVTVLSWA